MRPTLLLFALISSFHAFAGDDGALSLSPAVVMLRGDHGQSTTQTLTLHNGTSRPFSFDLVAQDVVIADGKRTFVEAASIAGSIAGTAIFSPARVDVPPRQTATVKVTVTLPPATAQRAIVAMFRGTSVVMSGHVPMTASLGTLLTFATSDTTELSAAPIAVRPQSMTANLGFSQSCTNSGREPLVARGVMAVLDATGTLIGKAELKPHRLMPGESAQLGGEYPGELEPGRYKLFVTYDYDGGTLTRSAEVDVR